MEWTSEKWFADVLEFRKNPALFLSVRRLEEETLIFDILQALCLDTVAVQTKIHLLGLIQEYSSLLCSTPNCVEQVTASLQDIFLQMSPDGATNICYMGQILVTITNLLITSDQLVTGEIVLFINFVNVLLAVVAKVNNGCDRTLRSTACECLTTIEVAYPGIFIRKLEHFNQICRKENTKAFQNYAILFVTALRNAVQHVTTETPNVNLINDLLCNRIEPFKPLTIPPHVKNSSNLAKQQSLQECLSEEVDTQELKRVTSDIMELCPMLTTPCVVNLALIMADIVEITPDLSPSIFKSLVLKYLPTTNLPLLHLLFKLKLRFGSDLFSDSESNELHQRLVLASNSPCLNVAECLLYLEWIKAFMDRKIGDDRDKLLTHLDSSSLFPRIFDCADEQVKKLQIISTTMKHSPRQDDSSWKLLMDALVCLHKPALNGAAGRRSVAIFRVLFNFHADHQVAALDEHIESFLVKLLTDHPKFSPHVLDFIESVLAYTPDSALPLQTLRRLVKHIISTAPGDAVQVTHFYLPVLERASQEPKIHPLATIYFLQKLLCDTVLCYHGDWKTGSELLAICKSILAYQDTRPFHKALGSLLFAMFTKFQDVEIRDRSKFYYALLCNLSSDKVSSILLNAGGKQGATDQLSNIVAGSTNFPTAAPKRLLDKPVIELQRIELETNYDTLTPTVPVVAKETNLLSLYRTCVLSPQFRPTIKLSYQIALVKDCEFDTIYAIALHIETPKCYQEIKNLYISSLTTDSEGKFISLPVCPEEPVPSSINIRAVFTSSSGITCECLLEPITVQFDDLFLLLPVPSGVEMTRQQLFSLLWENFTCKENSSQCVQSAWSHESHSSHVLKSVLSKLKRFTVYSNPKDVIHHVGILLPPQHHLLLKINERCFTIVTDNWKVLPLVSDWLNTLFNEAKDNF